jgi:bidirectional [NiFe] hydrogenase diaphorase subunit
MFVEEIHKLAEQELEARSTLKNRIRVCTGTACLSTHSDQLRQAFEQEVKAHGLEHICKITGGGCNGLCAAGPMVLVEPGSTWYQGVTPADVPEILQSLENKPIERLLCNPNDPFFARQTKVVLNHLEDIDPERLEDYLAIGGYNGLLTALNELTPAQVVETITKSGLRGRGGAGYPTGLKWGTVAKAIGSPKYVICNGDEGDPGAFMDRSLMESNPHAIIEGMAIAAYAVGANQGYLYVRAEYPLAIQRLQSAIKQASKQNLLGDNIAGTTFSFKLDIRLGAGAFVCGEETALIASIEGKRGSPRPRPPYPASSGLWGKPTLINNVETVANIPVIINNGAEWFANIGTEKSKGTKVFALTGRITYTGLIEVPMGMSLREIIYDIGGGIPGGRSFKAVQTGGPSGGCIPEEYLDMPVDYESLAKAGSIMGSGGMIVMDDTSCMVDVAKYFMEFCMSESCGKCVPCRVGTSQMHRLLEKITDGDATIDDLALLEELCDMVSSTSLCGLGQAAPNPVKSTLKFFRDEYMAHIVDKRCPAGVCKMKHAEVAR